MRTQGVRHTGCAVLDLCYVACGRVDALWEFGLRPWDVAAAALIVTEAGSLIENPCQPVDTLAAVDQGTSLPTRG